MKRSPLRRVSKKHAAELDVRREFVREQLSHRQWCEAGKIIFEYLSKISQLHGHQCMNAATELHEPLTRSRAPGLETIVDPANSVAICRSCHMWIHSHPAHATQIGLLKSGYPGRNS